MHFFEKIPLAPADPIFGLNIAYAQETRPNKVNLGVGAYKTENLKPYVLEAVRQSERRLLEMKLDKEYQPIDGDPQYLHSLLKLVLGGSSFDHIFAAQTLGGTGALRLGGQFLVEQGMKELFLPLPTWDNHARVFTKAGCHVHTYPYYDPEKKALNFPKMRAFLADLPPQSVILLHGCCHNPTGSDLSFAEWKELASLIKEKQLLPFFDFAYQGFGEGIAEDRAFLQPFIEEKIEFLLAASYSKNFGLYGERVGALFISCRETSQAKKVGSHIKVIIRSLYSNPPSQGSRIVRTILQDPELSALWTEEVAKMRLRIQTMRLSLIEGLEANSAHRFSFLKEQKGMFAYTGLSEVSVARLQEEFGIYLPKDGRVSLAGLNTHNLPFVIDAILKVI